MLITIVSCKESSKNAQEKKIDEKKIKEKNEDEIQKIGNLYQPEKMEVKLNKISTDNKKEDYQITLTNSDLLDSISENTEEHAKKIVNLYYKNLTKNIVPFNYNKITVNIEHRNGEKVSFKYSEKDFLTN